MGNGANGGQIANLIQNTPQLAQQLGQVPNGGLGTLAKTAVLPQTGQQTNSMFGGSGTAYPAGGLPTPKAKGGQNFSGGTPTPGGMPIENGFNNNVPAGQPMGGFGNYSGPPVMGSDLASRNRFGGQMGGFGGQMGGFDVGRPEPYRGSGMGGFGGQMGGFGNYSGPPMMGGNGGKPTPPWMGGQMGGMNPNAASSLIGSQMYAPPPAPMGMGNPMSAPNQNAAPPMGGVANILGGMGMMNQ